MQEDDVRVYRSVNNDTREVRVYIKKSKGEDGQEQEEYAIVENFYESW